MAIKTFRVGKLLIEGSQITSIESAQLQVNFAHGVTTPIGADWQDIIALGRDATLNVSCYYDPADACMASIRTEFMTGDGYLSAIQMWEDTSHYFGFSGCMVTTCNVSKTVGAQDKLTFTLVAKGTVVYT
jgi:hypothetical protein